MLGVFRFAFPVKPTVGLFCVEPANGAPKHCVLWCSGNRLGCFLLALVF